MEVRVGQVRGRARFKFKGENGQNSGLKVGEDSVERGEETLTGCEYVHSAKKISFQIHTCVQQCNRVVRPHCWGAGGGIPKVTDEPALLQKDPQWGRQLGSAKGCGLKQLPARTLCLPGEGRGCRRSNSKQSASMAPAAKQLVTQLEKACIEAARVQKC